MVESRKEVVELNWFPSENALPLERGDTGWSPFSKLDPEFTALDVSVENLERFASLLTDDISRST
jgi:hypothetical protein